MLLEIIFLLLFSGLRELLTLEGKALLEVDKEEGWCEGRSALDRSRWFRYEDSRVRK